MRIRTVLIGIVVIVVGLLVTGYAILKSLDLNDYKDVLAAKVKEATGRDLTLGGDIELAISFTPRLVVNDISFANADWGSRPEMATLERLEAVVDLWPLLSSEVRVNRFVLVGADVLLETDVNGNPNWGFPAAGGGSGTADAGAGGSGANYAISVDEISVERALITYRDGTTGETQTVTVESLSAAAEGADVPIALALTGSVNDGAIKLGGTLPSVTQLQGGGDLPLDLTIEAGGATITAAGVASPAAIDIALTASGQSLADLGALAGAVLPAIGPYSLAGQLTNPEGGFRLAGLELKIGGSTLTGDATVRLGGERPSILADLKSTRLDLADFGVEPAPEGEGTTPSGGDDGRVFPDDPLPFEQLRLVDAAVRFEGAEVIRAPQTLTGLSADIVLENGLLTVNHLGADLAGGKMAMSGVVDSRQSPAGIQLKLASSQIEGGALLQTLGQSPVFTGGRVDLVVDVAGSGDSVRQIMASLGGTTDFNMGPGQIDNRFARILLSDLFQLIASGGADGSDLNCVLSRFSITGGIAQSTALVLDTNGATILGEGNVDLRSEEPDILLVPNAKQTNLANLAVPVRIRGTLADPSVAPDPQAMAEGLVGSVGGIGTGIFSVLSGSGGSTAEGGGNACVAAVDSAASDTAAPSATDMITEGAGQMLEGAGQAGEGIGQGAGEVLDEAGKALEGLFGN